MLQPPRTLLEASRILRGLTQSDLAERLSTTQSMVSLLQSGKQRATSATVTNIAAVLEMPEALLRCPSPAPHIGHLIRSSLPRTARNRALAEVTMAHAHVDLLLDPIPAELDATPDGNPDDLADWLRDRWALQPGPISGMIPLFEEHGIVCVYRDLSALGVAALSSTAEQGRTLMFVDTSASRVELAWSLAHELGHLVASDSPSKESEARADAFAIAFLLPEQDLRADGVVRSAVDVAPSHGVRPRALVQRLRDLGMVTHAQFRQLVHDATGVPDVEVPVTVLGSPSALANRVRDAGGSRRAASHALLTAEELRRRYLARSRP